MCVREQSVSLSGLEGRRGGGALRWVGLPGARAVAALAVVLVIGCVFNAGGAFFHVGTHRDALRQMGVYGILACGMTLVVISGGIDLAVGSVMALVAVVFALTTIHWGWPPGVAIGLSLVVGTACGAVSGVLVAGFGLQPFIATLAMMVFARGLAKSVSGGEKVATAVRQGDGSYRYVDVPGVFRWIDSRLFAGNVAVVTVICFACMGVCYFLLRQHRWGRHLYAIGGNEEAAHLSGIRVGQAKIVAYAASGLLAGVAALCQAAQEQQGDPEAGNGYELTAIAMVVIGGNSLAGGRGGMGLTMLGMLTMGYLEKILSINAVPEAARLMLTGGIVVAAVLAQRRRSR